MVAVSERAVSQQRTQGEGTRKNSQWASRGGAPELRHGVFPRRCREMHYYDYDDECDACIWENYVLMWKRATNGRVAIVVNKYVQRVMNVRLTIRPTATIRTIVHKNYRMRSYERGHTNGTLVTHSHALPRVVYVWTRLNDQRVQERSQGTQCPRSIYSIRRCSLLSNCFDLLLELQLCSLWLDVRL